MSARRQFWLLQFLGWSAFIGALLLPWLGAIPLTVMLTAKIPLILAGVAATLLLRAVYRALLQRAAGGWVLAASVGVSSILAAFAWTRTADWISRVVLRGSEHVSLIRLSFDRFGGSWYCALALLAWSLLYFGVTQYQELGAERERSLRSESLARKAKLEALRYQINPHFLFNTLNAISTLVVEVRSSEAAEMISQLSDFLRLTLAGDSEADIALEAEVGFLRQYLEIERIRFGDRLEISIDIDATVKTLRVPALILLPIVENAIRHAVERNARGGHVAIRASRTAHTLYLAVSDDGPGRSGAPVGGSGIGLANTRARLHQLFGEKHALRRTMLRNGGTEYVIEIPIHNGTPARTRLVHI